MHRGRNDELTFQPQAELASRVAKQLLRIGQSVALVRGKFHVTDDELAIMKRIAMDSLPTNRRNVLTKLWEYRASFEPLNTFQDLQGVSPSTVRRMIKDFVELKVVRRRKKKVKKVFLHEFRLSRKFIKYLENLGGIE